MPHSLDSILLLELEYQWFWPVVCWFPQLWQAIHGPHDDCPHFLYVCIRPFDALGRFESDAFLIVLPGASNLVAAAVAERIRLTVVSRPEMLEDESLDIAISMGIASTSVFSNATPEMLVANAEKALLAARRLESNRIVQAETESLDLSL